MCPLCGGQMRIIAFITYSADIRQILDYIGVETEVPRITPARGPPLWDECDAQAAEGMDWLREITPAANSVHPWDAPNMCHSWAHAVGFPIRSNFY